MVLMDWTHTAQHNLLLFSPFARTATALSIALRLSRFCALARQALASSASPMTRGTILTLHRTHRPLVNITPRGLSPLFLYS